MGTKEHGPWPLRLCLPADQAHHRHPRLRPRHPHPLGSVSGAGRTHSEFLLEPEKLSTQLLPAGLEPAGHFVWLRLLWAPVAHHSLPSEAPQRNREWPMEGQEQGCRSRSEVPVQDSHALGTSPTLITGLGWHRGCPPTPDGPRPGTSWLQRTEPTWTAACPAHPLGLPRLTPRSAHVL